MHLLLTFLVLAGFAFQNAPPDCSLGFAEQTVECISVAHLSDGAELIFFWDLVQDDWTCLDHRWAGSAMIVAHEDSLWVLHWSDESENCYRVVRTRRWVESWESENPLSDQNQRPWFRQLLNPGLKQPQKLAGGAK